MYIFSLFFHISRTRSRNFATMAKWRNDFSSLQDQTWRLWVAHTYPRFMGVPPPETLTRNVSSSLGSLTLTACPLTASFRVCSSVGDVELVDSKATDGLLRILPCPFLDTGARCFRLVWGDRWTRFTPLSWYSFDSESSELLFSNKKKLTKHRIHTRKTVGLKANQLL